MGDSRIHIGSSNSSDLIANIKVLVNKYYSIASTLYILYIDLDNHHIRFWRNLNDTRFQYQRNIVENVVVLENVLDHIRIDRVTSIFLKIWQTNNLQI